MNSKMIIICMCKLIMNLLFSQCIVFKKQRNTTVIGLNYILKTTLLAGTKSVLRILEHVSKIKKNRKRQLKMFLPTIESGESDFVGPFIDVVRAIARAPFIY